MCLTGICPFNFPAMVPLWMFPMALVSGGLYFGGKEWPNVGICLGDREGSNVEYAGCPRN